MLRNLNFHGKQAEVLKEELMERTACLKSVIFTDRARPMSMGANISHLLIYQYQHLQSPINLKEE